MKNFPFEQFTSPLHRAWQHDRRLRQRIPLDQAWRGCLGLAAMWADVDRDFECVDDRCFYGNASLTWVCLRDIPMGRFPSSHRLNRRDVNYVNLTQAELRHGMPVLDFSKPTRDSWDFRSMPFGEVDLTHNGKVVGRRTAEGDILNSDNDPRLFGVLNQVSAGMTHFAYHARNFRGRPVRCSWFNHRPKAPSVQIPTLDHQFPVPYLGLTERDAYQAGMINEAVRLESRPTLVFVPAKAIAKLPHLPMAVELVWEMSTIEHLIDPATASMIFPPLRLLRWDDFEQHVGETRIEAGIGDPRFRHSPTTRQGSGIASQYNPNPQGTDLNPNVAA